MGFMLREEKESLLTEYDILREEIWDRDYKTWVVNAILIMGSIVAAFSSSSVKGFPTAALSVSLIAAAVALHATSEQVTSIAYVRVKEIEQYLKIAGPTRLFESKIADQWWYVARRNVAYVLFTVLEAVYLYLVYPNIFVFVAALVVGLVLVFLKEKGFGRRKKEAEPEKMEAKKVEEPKK